MTTSFQIHQLEKYAFLDRVLLLEVPEKSPNKANYTTDKESNKSPRNSSPLTELNINERGGKIITTNTISSIFH